LCGVYTVMFEARGGGDSNGAEEPAGGPVSK